jgi:hypothetical protein
LHASGACSGDAVRRATPFTARTADALTLCTSGLKREEAFRKCKTYAHWIGITVALESRDASLQNTPEKSTARRPFASRLRSRRYR